MSYNPYSLEGKTIFVTGASSGIGKATAIECARLGAKLVITARNSERLNDTLGALEGDGHRMVIADLTKESEIAALADTLPMLDGFVCNAGITKRKPINFIKEEELCEIFNINTFSCIMLTKAIMKARKMNKSGSMVFISSKAAIQNTVGNSMYAASKAAIASFSRSCALEYAAQGIRANAVLPGMVETPLILTNGMLSAEDMEKDKASYMLRRYGRPEEIAWSIIFLLSDASGWITGSSLVIDGGGA